MSIQVKLAGLIAAALLAGAPFASAQQNPEGGKEAHRSRLFERLDADGDGRLTEQEYKGPRRLFQRLDRNGDGAITPEETPGHRLRQRLRERCAERFRRLDADGDGALSRAEWKGPAELFERLDADGDGRLVPEELRAAGARLRERLRERLRDRRAERFRRLDRNGDGALDRTEWKGPARLFDRLDRDGDGRLVPEELRRPRRGAHGANAAAASNPVGEEPRTAASRSTKPGTPCMLVPHHTTRTRLVSLRDARGTGTCAGVAAPPAVPARAGGRGAELARGPPPRVPARGAAPATPVLHQPATPHSRRNSSGLRIRIPRHCSIAPAQASTPLSPVIT
ncbi:MAG: hypothetical protein KatS3mg102_2323 [Planctomycetota bacterium]|nr:MAG: hypothetical protein KatS3mg102_2323 [Planctomycetota bacterium]